MITEIWGDIFESTAQCIGHGTNAKGKIGSRLSRTLALRYPDAHAAYVTAVHTGQVSLGGVHLAAAVPHNILHLIVQESIGEPPWKGGRTQARPGLIGRGLDAAVSLYEEGAITSVALPRLGCGRGGLYWNRDDYEAKCNLAGFRLDRPGKPWIEDVLHDAFRNSTLPVEVWHYPHDEHTA